MQKISLSHQTFDKSFIVTRVNLGFTGGRVKRKEVVEFLKEILRECGELFVIEMIWLRNTEPEASPENSKYQLVIKAKLDRHAVECIKPIADRYGLEMDKQEDLWVFAKDTKTFNKFALSSNKT